MKTKLLPKLILPLIAISLMSCGKKKSDGVEFVLNPSKPVVIDADFSYPDDTSTPADESLDVTGPWFKFRFTIKNRTGSPVTVVGIKTETTGTKNGLPVTTTGEHASDDETFPYLATAASDADATSPFTYYSDSLPEADSFRYRVKMTVTGWFGTYDDPTERFEKIIYFTTE